MTTQRTGFHFRIQSARNAAMPTSVQSNHSPMRRGKRAGLDAGKRPADEFARRDHPATGHGEAARFGISACDRDRAPGEKLRGADRRFLAIELLAAEQQIVIGHAGEIGADIQEHPARGINRHGAEFANRHVQPRTTSTSSSVTFSMCITSCRTIVAHRFATIAQDRSGQNPRGPCPGGRSSSRAAW